jgi:hypothetical protein
VYVAKDGSVLYLSYDELSENPFLKFPLPFFLHDCGAWTVDGTKQSTGIFAGVTGGGEIKALVPVRTDFSAHVNATSRGMLTFPNGPMGPGPGVPPGPPGPPGDTHCTGYMTGAITGNVTVDNGQSCILDSAAVNGDVHVHNGGSLTMQYSIAAGDVHVDGAGGPTTFYASTALGNLDIHNGSGGVTLFNAAVGGNADVQNNNGPLTILVSPSIGGNLDVHDNTGFSLVSGNIVGNNVDCHGNNPDPLLYFSPDFSAFGQPDPVFYGNEAPNLKGQCSVFGLGPQEPTGP